LKRRGILFVVLAAALLLVAFCATAFADFEFEDEYEYDYESWSKSESESESGSGTPLAAPPKKGLGAKTGDKNAFLLDGPVNIDADNLSYDEENGVAVAEGNVEVLLGPRKMLADRISYSFRTGEIELMGEVRYTDADEQFSFDRATLNLNTETGVFYNGTILINPNDYRIFGEKIEKTGKQSFQIQKGSITTCPCDPTPDWEFGTRRSDIVIEGYAVSKDVTVRVRGVPVLWLPYAVFPVKMSRQSGLLIPTFSTSRTRGITFSLPYYWAINRWSDATVTVDAMAKRGIRPELEYRFILNPDSEGMIQGSFLKNDNMAHKDRWRIRGHNIYHSGDWTVNAKLEIPSDNQYYVDLERIDTKRFTRHTMLRSARHTYSTGFIGWSGEESSHQLAVTWVEEMERFPADNTLQRLPEYQAALLPYRTAIGGIEASGEMSATYFYRDEGDKAGRTRGSMKLSRTFVPLPSVSIKPYVSGYLLGTRHEQHDEWSSTGSFIPVAGVHATVEAQRSFLENGSGFVHVVGTDVDYRHVSDVGQENMPVFDRWSRLTAQDQVVFTLSQRLFRMKNAASPKETASMILEWAYDFNKRRSSDTTYVDPLSPFVRVLRDQVDLGHERPMRTGNASEIYGKFTVRPFDRWHLDGEALFDPLDAAFSMASIGGGWEKNADRRIRLGYRVTRELAKDIWTSLVWRPMRFLRLHANMNYSVKNSRLTSSSAGIVLMPKSECWNVGLTTVWNTYPMDVTYRLIFSLKGIGSTGNK